MFYHEVRSIVTTTFKNQLSRYWVLGDLNNIIIHVLYIYIYTQSVVETRQRKKGLLPEKKRGYMYTLTHKELTLTCTSHSSSFITGRQKTTASAISSNIIPEVSILTLTLVSSHLIPHGVGRTWLAVSVTR